MRNSLEELLRRAENQWCCYESNSETVILLPISHQHEGSPVIWVRPAFFLNHL